MSRCSLLAARRIATALAIAAAAACSLDAAGQITPQPEVVVMERISVSGQGVVETGRLSELPWISPDGRFVVFTSPANTLDRAEDEIFDSEKPFTGPDTGQVDVYLVDRSLPATDEGRVRRLSRSQVNNGTPNGGSSFGVIDDAASVAVFQSKAKDLDPDVDEEGSISFRRLYMVDIDESSLDFGETSMFVLGYELDENDEPFLAGQRSRFPAISGDGRFVYFSSRSQALPRVDGTPFPFVSSDEDVFRYDVTTGTFGLVTPASNERDGFPSTSFDGQWVVIESEETAAILTGLPLDDLNSGSDIFLVQGASLDGSAQPPTYPVSLSLTPNTMGEGDSRFPTISHDGRFVAFISWADDLVADDGLGNPDTFLRDMGADPSTNTGPTVRVSVGGSTTSGPVVDNTAESGCAWGCRPSVVHIPSHGVVAVAFVTLGGFDDFDENDAWDVYVRVMPTHDLSAGDTYLVSAPAHDSSGFRTAADLASFNPHLRAELVPEDPEDPEVLTPQLSLRIAFESYATNLDPLDNVQNRTRNIWYSELLVPVPTFE